MQAAQTETETLRKRKVGHDYGVIDVHSIREPGGSLENGRCL